MIKRVIPAAILLAATTPALAELSKTAYGDWEISCKDTNYCIAETRGTGSNDEAFRLKIERGADPDSTVYVSLDPKTTLEIGMKARIEIEGEEENYGYFGIAEKIYSGNEMTFGGDADRLLIEKLRLGTNAIIQIEFGTRTITYWVSLNGVTEALLRMDQEQGRIGRLDAIVAWGGNLSDDAELEKQEAARPVMPSEDPDAGSESMAAGVQPQQFFNADGDLESGIAYDLAEVPDTVQMMGYRMMDCDLQETVPMYGAQYYVEGDVMTYVVPCRSADLNVPYYMVTHIPFNPSLDELHEFETPPHFNQPDRALVHNLFFDRQTWQVTGTTYYSDGYDCGVFERHEQQRESGEYTLMEYYEKTDCDGIAGPPEGWPLEWTEAEMGG